ncbi:MAG: hypothetical protein ACK48X_08640, partial [Planctomycetota bacterium]
VPESPLILGEYRLSPPEIHGPTLAGRKPLSIWACYLASFSPALGPQEGPPLLCFPGQHTPRDTYG